MEDVTGCKRRNISYGILDYTYEGQRAAMMDIVSVNSNEAYPKSVTELLRLEEKKYARRLITS
jgi:hypothetical protein